FENAHAMAHLEVCCLAYMKHRVAAAQRSGLSPCRRWHELHLCRNIAARDEIRQPGLDNRPHIGPDCPVVVFLHRDDDIAAYLGVGAEGKDGDIDKRSAIDLSGNLPQSFLAPPAQHRPGMAAPSACSREEKFHLI